MAQKTIYQTLTRIRPEWNNIRNNNGRYETIKNRLEKKWAIIDNLVEKHGPDKLGAATMAAIAKERQTYWQLVPERERRIKHT